MWEISYHLSDYKLLKKNILPSGAIQRDINLEANNSNVRKLMAQLTRAPFFLFSIYCELYL